jgi:predicted ATP-dependent endonuclease of OLD family
MRYVFMHNFRGFSETLLPLRQTTFLVGENSAGKSSVLKLLYVLSRPRFWFSPDAPFQDEAELGGFDDIVSGANKGTGCLLP